jgi:hypothetical protein
LSKLGWSSFRHGLAPARRVSGRTARHDQSAGSGLALARRVPGRTARHDQSAGSGLALARRVPGRTARHESSSQGRVRSQPSVAPGPRQSLPGRRLGFCPTAVRPLGGASRRKPPALPVDRYLSALTLPRNLWPKGAPCSLLPLGQNRRERFWSSEARPKGFGQDCPKTKAGAKRRMRERECCVTLLS